MNRKGIRGATGAATGTLSANEEEKRLLEKLREGGEGRLQALWDLARFYSLCARPAAAFPYIEESLSLATEPEMKASALLAAGQLMEQIGDYAAALSFYARGLEVGPSDPQVRYLLENNSGYCLNRTGRYAEAERHCREAITWNPHRYNAYKNLGVSAEGQGRFDEAARAYICATIANPFDLRAYRRLERLLAAHTEVASENADIVKHARYCWETVMMLWGTRTPHDTPFQERS